jgi:hypothetical protein
MGICIRFYEFIVDFLTGFAHSLNKTTFKISVTGLFVTLFVTAVTAYVTAAKALVAGLVSTMPPVLLGVWGWFMPSNFFVCMTAITACYTLRFFTKHYLRLFEAKHRAAISN